MPGAARTRRGHRDRPRTRWGRCRGPPWPPGRSRSHSCPVLRRVSRSRTAAASSARTVSVAAASPARPPPAGMVTGFPTCTSTRGRKRRRAPSGRRVPRHTTGTTTAPVERASHAAPCWTASTSPRAAGALGEDRDQPARTQHVDGCGERGPVGRPAADRDLPDPGQHPPQRTGEHLLLHPEHRATAKKSEQQRPVDERAVVGDDDHRLRWPGCAPSRAGAGGRPGSTTRSRSSGRDRASAATPRRAGRPHRSVPQR